MSEMERERERESFPLGFDPDVPSFSFFLFFFSLKMRTRSLKSKSVVRREPHCASELPDLSITEIRSSCYDLKKQLPWIWAPGTVPALRRPRQEDHQSEASLGYRQDPVSKRKKRMFFKAAAGSSWEGGHLGTAPVFPR